MVLLHCRRSLSQTVAAWQVLAALLVCPNKGGLLGRLAWALGRGIGEYLLQQAQWVLQVCCLQPAQGCPALWLHATPSLRCLAAAVSTWRRG